MFKSYDFYYIKFIYYLSEYLSYVYNIYSFNNYIFNYTYYKHCFKLSKSINYILDDIIIYELFFE